MLIDSHCHLNHKRMLHLGQPEDVVRNAKEAGVDAMLTICCRITEEFEDILAIAKANDNVWCTVGTHPHDASQEGEKSITSDRIVELACSDPKVIGIGETGLDYFYKHSTPEDQKENFEKHIAACLETDLPIIVHSRDADEDTAAILRDAGQGQLRGVMHCFSSGPQLAKDALDCGFYISFSGIVTFKNSQELRDIAKSVPLDRILVETDSPFLAPEPHRGKINEPALVKHTAQCVADIHGISAEELAKHSTENFYRLFNQAK